jgi:predicted dehydrogenase
MADNPMRAIILGYGIRGRAYAAYAESHPDEFEIAGLADPVAAFPANAPCPTWKSWEQALDAGVKADAVIVALPDRLHRNACVKALERGYHVLLEKPIGCTWEECQDIRNAQIASRKIVLTGYVLRFAPFYKKLREVIASGCIGNLTSVHHLAAISYGKSSHAYCRGNWSVEAKGTGMLVNKCTHDFDLIEWWTKGKKCTKVSSFGSLMHWRPENRPAGAADRCMDCPAQVRDNCAFDAYKIYYDRKDLRYHFADESDAAILKMIQTSPYGRCVYACGNDSVDHQTVLMEYEGGLTIILEMESYSQQRTRITHFYGTRGEICADETKIEIKPFLGDSTTIIPAQHGHHGGGDREIMAEFVKLVRGASPERYTKILDAALESHRIAFLAEESRRTGKTMNGLTGAAI